MAGHGFAVHPTISKSGVCFCRNVATNWPCLGSALGRQCPGCCDLGYVQETHGPTVARPGCAVEVPSVSPNATVGIHLLWKLRMSSEPKMGSKIPLPPHEPLEASLEAPEQRSSSSRCLEGASPHSEGKTRSERKLFISLSPSPPLQVSWGGRGWTGISPLRHSCCRVWHKAESNGHGLKY